MVYTLCRVGFLRLFFALSVVVAHTASSLFGYSFFNSSLAVTAFFVISGFYMSLILQEKYSQKNSYSLFLTNRLLRIYPTYWLALILTLIVTAIYANGPFFYTSFSDFFSNVTLLIRPDYFEINPEKFQTFTIYPAWTLTMELLFYLIAPFVVKSTKKILILMILSIIIRYLIYHYATIFHVQPSIRFFPVELVYFLLGALSYKIYAFLKKKKLSNRTVLIVSLSFMLFTILYYYLPFIQSAGRWASTVDHMYILLLFTMIPFCFLYFKNSRVDRMLGDLSYPVYLFHIFVITVFSVYFQSMDKNLYTVLVILATILLAQLTVTYLENPIDKWRQKRLKYTVNKIRS